MGAIFIPGTGVILTMRNESKAMRIVVPPLMTVAMLERHLKEVREWIS